MSAIELLKRAAGVNLIPPVPAFVVTINDRTINGAILLPGTAFASWISAGNGRAIQSTNNTGNQNLPSEWLFPAPTSTVNTAKYEIQAVQVSQTGGGNVLGTFNVFLSQDVTQSWTLEKTDLGLADLVFDLTIRLKVGQVIQDTARITLTAEGIT